MDIDKAAIRRARVGCPEARFWLGSFEADLPFDDGIRDGAWRSEVLEHPLGEN
jgi:hypothetical protein